MRQKILAVLLAVVLCCMVLGGCFFSQEALREVGDAIIEELQERESAGIFPEMRTPSIGPAPVVISDEDRPAEGESIVFSQIVYVRPDMEEVADWFEEAAAQVLLYTEYEPLDKLLDDVDTLYDDCLTMYYYARLRSDMDLSDSYWLEEVAYLLQGFTMVDVQINDLHDKILMTSFEDEIEERYGDDFFVDLDEPDMLTEHTQPLFEQEGALVISYSEMLATGAVEYDGESYVYADLWNGETPDGALEAWYEEYNQKLGELYIELLRVRQQIAHELDFENYMEYVLYDKAYDSDMLEQLIDHVATYITPVYEDLLAVGTNYYPEIDMPLDEFIPYAQDVFQSLSPEFLNGFDFMLEYELYDLEPRPYKDGGAYEIYLPAYNIPFILATYDESFYGLDTLVHEFGHFEENYRMGADLFSDPDMAEVFSQALQLVFSNSYESEFGEDTGYMMRYDVLSDVFCSIPEQLYYTSMEMQLYQMDADQLTVEQVNEIAEQELDRFGISYFDPELERLDWVATPHIFESPFYTASYVTSASAALELWEISIADEQQAVDIYMELMDNKFDYPFLENLEHSGLADPFAEKRMREIAQIAERYLVEEDWEPAMQEDEAA
ncbi:MAG: M3 family metallopeptidase [Christensenellaceae bacterium]